MSGKPFEKSFELRYAETGIGGGLHIASMMRCFEEMALLQSEAGNVGLDYYHKHHVAWVLRSFDIRIDRMPVYPGMFHLRTLPISVYRFMGYRRFWVYLPDGSIGVEADSAWVFIDTRTKRPLRVSDDMKQAYGHAGAPEQRLDMDDIPILEREDIRQSFGVRRSDIDVNRHVNNVSYVNWTLETLPEDIHSGHSLKRLRIDFLQEMHYGETADVCIQLDKIENQLRCLVTIKGDEKERCRMAAWFDPSDTN